VRLGGRKNDVDRRASGEGEARGFHGVFHS
jgi:hypothetical protein